MAYLEFIKVSLLQFGTPGHNPASIINSFNL
jgi:hypothetical protein